MKPNTFFSFKRFGRFLSAYLQLNYKSYLTFFGIMFVTVYLLALYQLNQFVNMPVEYIHSDVYYIKRVYTTMFVLGLFMLGAFIGSAFPELSDKIKTSNYLLLPASTFEKLASQFLIYIIGGCLLYLLIFWVDAHLGRWTMLHHENVISGQRTIEAFSFSIFMLERKSDFLAYFLCIGIGFFLFAVRLFFKKYALGKTVIALIVFGLLCWLTLSLASHIFFPEWTDGFGDIAIPDYYIADGLNNVIAFFVFLSMLVCIVALPLAYYKLKEKKV